MNTAGETESTITNTEYLDQKTGQPEEDEEYFSTDPEVIFRREYSKLDTIILVLPVSMRLYMLFFLIFASFLAGSIIGLVTYPTVTVTIVPVSKTVILTTQLDLPTHQLAPVTITKSQTAPTTGKGHQNAAAAGGTLTFYNGKFSSQMIPAGTIYTGSDGVKIVTSETLTIPAAQPPQFAVASTYAYALRPGAKGNITAGDINLALSSDLLVKNLTAFTGGHNARDFQAVAQADLNTLTMILKTALVERILQAFSLQPGETVTPTDCRYSTTADHGPGEEATTVTMKASYTCKGIAYNTQELERKAVAVFTTQILPGAQYELLNTSHPQVIKINPLTVEVSGTWVYTLSQDYKQFLAERIAGDSPQDAKAYLLRTGFIIQATIPGQLPKDPGHIHFQILVGL